MFLDKKSFRAFVIVVLAYVVYKLFFQLEYSPVIEISTGKVRGFLSKSRIGKDFYQFRGIPYAKTPERFEISQPAESWTGVLDATFFGSMCVHVDPLSRKVTGSENCLYLNVFSPKDYLTKNEELPVIVYIHGGYFMTGASNFFGPEYLLDERVIVVTFNYRLNAFGFLSTGDGVVRGNIGLKDQHLALKWVQQNIKSFGGDRTKIIISGQSAGAAAVHFHVLSPLSKGLFAGAIMSSGTAIKPWSLSNNPKAQVDHLAKIVKCSGESSVDIIKCLKTLDAYEIALAHRHALDTPVMNNLEIFAPTIEDPNDPDAFLPYHPYDILVAGNATKVPILTGVNADEGLLATGRILFNKTLLEKVETDWNHLSPELLIYDKDRKDVTKKICQFYWKDNSNCKINLKEKFQNITNAFTDRLYIHATKETAKIQSKFSPVYLYYFSYHLRRSVTYFYDINHKWPLIPQFIWKEIKSFINEYILQQGHPLNLGVMHGDDIVLVFKFPAIFIFPGMQDFEISRKLVKMWVAFAQNPSQLVLNGKVWPPVNPMDKQTLKYMSISGRECHESLIDEPFSERMKFWDDLNLPWKEKS